MKHKIVLFALLAPLTSIPTVASAYDFSAVAPSGQRLYYNIVDNAVTVTSQIDSYPYYSTRPTGDIIIPDNVEFNNVIYPVTAIGTDAFGFCSDITSVTVPSSVTIIGACAFSNCYNIESITLLGAVTTIGHEAFISCNRLSSFTIPNTVSNIGYDAFMACYDLASIFIPASVTSIGYGIFSSCHNLTSITVDENNPVYDSRGNCNAIIETSDNELISGCQNTIIPNSVTAISNNAFEGLVNLTTITIPTSVVSIGRYAFYNSGLTSIDIPGSVSVIEQATFLNCYSLASISFSSSLTTIKKYAFQGCSSLTSLTIPDNITSIEESAFGECGGLTSIVVSEGNPNYDSRNNCNAIIESSSNTLIAGSNNTVIPPDVTTLGKKTFFGCNFTSFTIPASVSFIDDYALFACYNLNELYVQAEVSPTLGEQAFFGMDMNIPVYVPCGSLADYQSADGWSQFTNIQEVFNYTVSVSGNDDAWGSAAVTTNPSCADNSATITATSNCGFRFVRWEDAAGATVSTDNPFTLAVTQDTALTAVFETGGTRISLVCPSGQTLYYLLDCANHTATVVPENDSYPYYTTYPTGGLTIPSSITANGGTFSVTSIGRSAFEGCFNITSVTIPSTVTTIDNSALENTGIQSLTIPNSVTNIGYSAFRDCSKLTSITIPSSVTGIGGNAFLYCSKLTSITVDAGNTTYDSRNNCNAIIETATNKLITGCDPTAIPNTVVTIGSFAFAMFKDFPSIFIPNSVTSIEEQAFYCGFRVNTIVVDAENTHYDSRENCNAIIETSTNKLILGCINTIIPNTVTCIGSNAFVSCSNLTSITIPGSVTSIGPEAFRGCNLTEVISLATIPPTLSYLVFHNISHDAFSVISVYVPCGKVADYQAADEWNQFTNIQERFPYTVTATSADNTMGTAAVTTDPTCANNSTTVAATPNCGYRFVRWENAAGNTVSTDNPCTLTVSRDTTLIAVFETGETRISLVCPSGQMLYYRLDCTNLTATVVPQNGSNPYYTTEPAGNLVIPSSIEYGNNTYTVTTIGENAFRYCTSLTSAVIPNSITSIGGHAFFDCWGIESLSIGNSVETIGFEAFASCYGLSSITVAADNTHFDSRNNCNAIIVTATNTLIAGCQTTVIPNSVTAIGDNAFGNCETLTTIHIPSAVSYIHERAFMNCSGLISMTVDADNTHYDSRENCNAIIETSTNTLIAGCRNTVIPNSVTSIAEYAFRYCSYLTSITIPSKVASIGSESFYGCSNLAQITLLAPIPPSIGNTTFQYVSTDIPVNIPCGTLSAYQASNRWSSFTNLIEGDLFPYSLSVTSAHSAMGSAAVTVQPTCANNGATITATPNSGYLFDHWSDGNTDNPRTLTITQDSLLTAIFGIGATTDTAIHIHMEMVGDSLFSQENQSMVVTHPDSTYVKLRFDVEPTAERIEVLDQAQNLVATFYNATEEHIFRLTTGFYTIRAVFPGGATFEGTIDFTNELQE